jgi:undecaprenyl-diphosphatase
LTASVYSCSYIGTIFSAADAPLFAVGFLVSFISAFIVVKAFLRYVAHHSFSAFAWYRIAIGATLLWLASRGVIV